MKRFYKEVDIAEQDGGWRIMLDGRPLRTVGGRAQVLPRAALAEALAAEWAAQGEEINPASFVLRDMADYAIDVVGTGREAAIRELLPYAETDTLCYRAEEWDPLREEQDRVWEPLLTSAEARLGKPFARIGGVMHRPQPPVTLAAVEAVLAGLDDFALAALRNLAGLAASLIIGLAALEPDADIDALWRAANLEEDWQADRWGHDAEALARQDKRRAVFEAAARFAVLARG